jgi:HSP20 family protein
MLGSSLIRRPSSDPLSDFVDHFFDRSLFRPWNTEGNGLSRAWAPAVDLRQSDTDFSIVVDLPGLKKDDINLTVENDTLTLSGERKFENEENSQAYSLVERAYGKFSRTFSLPSNVDTEAVKAEFHEGVLTVAIPKLEKARSRQISIK